MSLREQLEWAGRMAFLVFILASAAFLSAITAMRFAIHGREVTMPNLVGKDVGEASKTLGASHGTWTVVNGEARIAWDDGWHDALRRVGEKFEKVAYSPGTTFDDKPANVADAVNTSPQPN